MKSLKKTLIALIIVTTMVFSLSACSLYDMLEGMIDGTNDNSCENHVDKNDDGKCDVEGCDADCNDGCDAEHKDANDDGKCDLGGEAFDDGCDAEHKDANDDGKCDFGGEAFDDGCDAEHKDANDDGKCDLGGEAFDDGCDAEHKDANDDGKCDFGGETFDDGCDAEHKDANDDGKCDFGGEAFDDGCDAEHKDANDDGKCDFGGEGFEDGCDAEHKDANDDGKCDFGGEVFYDGCDAEHKDANDDGKCDLGGEAFVDGCDTKDCFDTDNDGICDNDGCDKETANKPGSSFATAVELTEGEAGYHDIYTYNQKHYYKFTASVTHAFDVEFWGYYFNIDVYSADSTTEALASWVVYYEGNINNTIDLEEGKTYYFVVTSQYDYGAPEITVTVAEETEVEADPGTTFESAITLEEGVKISIPSSTMNQKFYYQFTASATSSFDVLLNGWYYTLNVYSADDTTSAIKSVTHYYDASTYTVELEEGKTYYFVLTSDYGYNVDMTVSVSSGEVAPGTTFETALDLAEDEKLSIATSTMGQKFYYQLTASKSGEYSILLDGWYYTLNVYSADDTTTAIMTVTYYSDASTYTVELEADKTYYFVLTSDYGYNINMTVSAPAAGEPETPECTEHVDAEPIDGKCDVCGEDMPESEEPSEENGFDNATTLTEGTTEFATITAKGQKLYYKLTASTSGAYKISCLWGYYIQVDVYSADDLETAIGTWDTGYSGVNETLELVEGNTYYIVLTSYLYDYGYPELTVSAPEVVETPECTEHVDADDNGICDNDGCDVEFTDGCDTKDCLDTDNDGLCDNDGCDKATENKPEVEEPPVEVVPDGLSFETAYPLEDGVAASGAAGSTDKYYKFVVTAAGSYRITFNANYYKLYLYNATNTEEGTLVGSTDYLYNAKVYSVDLVEGTYYFLIDPQYSYYGYEITVEKKPDCAGHVDADDDAKCDVCKDDYSDGCDLKDCADVNGDGLCDNKNCDDPTDNIAAGATINNAIEVEVGSSANVSIILASQKVYIKFVATANFIDLAVDGSYPRFAVYSADNTSTALFTGSNYGSSIKKTLEGLTIGATYYIAISNCYDYAADYTVSLTEGSDPFDAAAEIVADGEKKSVSFEAYEKKYFKFTATVTGSYTVSVDNGYYNSEFYLYDADRNAIVGPLTGTYNSSTYGYVTNATLELTEGTTYYVLINFTGSYTTNVKITFTAPAAE